MRKLLFVCAIALAHTLSVGQANRMVLTAERLKELEVAAASNDLRAQGYLASIYSTGFSVDGKVIQDKERANALAKASLPGLERQADKGDTMLMYMLATYFEKAIGVPQDRPKAQALFRRAAQEGLTSAQREYALSVLSLARERGEPTVEQVVDACAWMTVAAENGNRMAKTFLGDTCAGVAREKSVAAVLDLKKRFPKVKNPLPPNNRYTPFEPRK